MKGWLFIRGTGLAARSERYFFRLRWGFLSQHLTELSAAVETHFLDGASVRSNLRSCAIELSLGPSGLAFALASGKAGRGKLILKSDNLADYAVWVRALQRSTYASFFEHFFPLRVLGAGACGEVWLAELRRDRSVRVAVKRVGYALPTQGAIGRRLVRVHREIALQARSARLTRLVPDVVGVYFDGRSCYIAMEYANGGSLSAALRRGTVPLTESVVRVIATRLGKCLLALHQAGIVHRDVKCDNVVLCESEEGLVDVRLIDFGFAAVWRDGGMNDITNFCTKFVGTETYLAPELAWRMTYGAPVDVYSLGVIVHICLVGQFPFKAGTLKDTIRLIREGNLCVLDGNAGNISADAVSFCRSLLQRRSRTRLSAAGLLQHRWLRGPYTAVSRRRPGNIEECKAVFRRMFWAVCAIRILITIENSIV